MKTVKFPHDEINDKIVFSKNVKCDDFIGFSMAGGSHHKGFVTRSGYMSGKFLLLSKSNISIGNRWTNGAGNDFSTFTEMMKFLSSNRFEVYVFEDEKELFSWLAVD